jgi:FkbM family methyltransferase
MSFMTSNLAIGARSLLRKTGVSSVAMRLLRARNYETLLTDAMMRAVSPGDCVWDVGSNAGFYARQFAQAVGASGHVYAYEPSKDTRAMMELGDFDNITVMPFALSKGRGTCWLDRGEQDDGATARIADHGSEQIDIETGDCLIASGAARSPNLIKIDVEGHELDALIGLRDTLASPHLHHIFIEVHFFIFGQSGRNEVPKEIETLLRNTGFRISWVDQSHLHASR